MYMMLTSLKCKINGGECCFHLSLLGSANPVAVKVEDLQAAEAGQSSGQRLSSSISNAVAVKVELLQAAKAGQRSGKRLSSSVSNAVANKVERLQLDKAWQHHSPLEGIGVRKCEELINYCFHYICCQRRGLEMDS